MRNTIEAAGLMSGCAARRRNQTSSVKQNSIVLCVVPHGHMPTSKNRVRAYVTRASDSNSKPRPERNTYEQQSRGRPLSRPRLSELYQARRDHWLLPDRTMARTQGVEVSRK